MEMPERWKFWRDFIDNPSSEMEDAVSKEEMHLILLHLRNMATALDEYRNKIYYCDDGKQLKAPEEMSYALNRFEQWK